MKLTNKQLEIIKNNAQNPYDSTFKKPTTSMYLEKNGTVIALLAHIEALEAEQTKALAEARQALEWRPIAECPIDENIMLFIPGYCSERAIGHIDKNRVCCLDNGNEFDDIWKDEPYPTHWQPLRQPPKEGVDGPHR